MKHRGDSLWRRTVVLLLALAPFWSACSSSSGNAKTSEPAAPAAAPAETAPPAAATSPEAEPQGAPASTRPLPGTLPYSADRIREIEGSLKPLKPIPTPARSTNQNTRRNTGTQNKIASPKLTRAERR